MQKNLCIYLIDDDPDDQEFFAMATEGIGTGLQLEVADSGKQAVERLKSDHAFKPNFIFIDMNMPCMNGIECLIQLKQIERLNKATLYLWSTSADPGLTQSCISIGAAGFIQKIPSIQLLKQLLWNIFYEQNTTCG